MQKACSWITGPFICHYRDSEMNIKAFRKNVLENLALNLIRFRKSLNADQLASLILSDSQCYTQLDKSYYDLFYLKL